MLSASQFLADFQGQIQFHLKRGQHYLASVANENVFSYRCVINIVKRGQIDFKYFLK